MAAGDGDGERSLDGRPARDVAIECVGDDDLLAPAHSTQLHRDANDRPAVLGDDDRLVQREDVTRHEPPRAPALEVPG